VERHEELCDDVEIHFVELPNLKRSYDQERAANRMLTGWSSFLAAKTDEEIEAAAKEDPMIDQAKEVLERLSEDPKVRELASWREAHLALDKMQREMERREALEEGREEGIQEGEKRGVKKGLKEGEKAGKRQLLLRLIEQRFGAITPQRLERVEAGDIDRLTARLFEAETFDELFEEG
jgi:predicted transposase/invertase (TIGR01784 family)